MAEWPGRGFGFHGLSHAYASRRARKLGGSQVDRVVTWGGRVEPRRGGRRPVRRDDDGLTPERGDPDSHPLRQRRVGMLTWLVSAGLEQGSLPTGCYTGAA